MNIQFKHPITQATLTKGPSVFALTKFDPLSGKAINHRAIQNKHFLSFISEECFVRDGNRVMIVTEPFLAWKSTRIKTVRFTSKKNLVRK